MSLVEDIKLKMKREMRTLVANFSGSAEGVSRLEEHHVLHNFRRDMTSKPKPRLASALLSLYFLAMPHTRTLDSLSSPPS